ncbi:hypothetical protein [Glycomyces sp. NPDC047010]|uniref:hypothetical protein n=1 Tax=Glycomyces sp. NPDC047010 TaxID=3155023 RepID=UPI00340E3D3C
MPRMVANEIAVLGLGALDGSVEGAGERVLGGVPYLVFRSASLSGRDLRLLSNTSGLFALFEMHGTMLEPVPLQHAAVRDTRELSRRPTELLEAAIPVWAGLLKPGGAMGLSWNTYTTERSEMADMLEAAGLEVLDAPLYLDFEHCVDHAIIRDLIVARVPR